MPKPLTILFVGGGSLGHVVPSLAVAGEIKRLDPSVRCVFVCSDHSDEREMIRRAGYDAHGLRAPTSSFSFGLLLFPLRLMLACLCARKILRKEQPTLIFSKGGSVSMPVCLIAWWNNIPVVLHESDSVVGRASSCIARMATIVCSGFPDVAWPTSIRKKVTLTGNPIRASIFSGSEAAGQRITGFSGKRPVLLVIGGSQGSEALNQAVSKSQTELIALADLIHLSGVGKKTAASHARYFVRPTVDEELPHLYALADIVLSRSGAGILSELAALKKTVITVPLAGVAQDHQVRNADVLARKNAVIYLKQTDLDALPQVVSGLLKTPDRSRALGETLHAFFPNDAAKKIARLTLAEAKKHPLES